jgi:hypothetical protein
MPDRYKINWRRKPEVIVELIIEKDEKLVKITTRSFPEIQSDVSFELEEAGHLLEVANNHFSRAKHWISKGE